MKDSILTLLKNNKDYLSGQKIAGELRITRNAVHKRINILRSQGYNIISMRSYGYKLVDDLNCIDFAAVGKSLTGHLLGGNIIHYNTIGSTNDEAYRLAQSGGGEGAVVISDRQTKGRGRMGREWVSASSENLYFSVILKPKMLPSFAPRVTVMSAIAVAQAIMEVTGLKPGIKWPNDIYIGGKKVCGILTQMKSESDAIDFIITGIGVNVNSQPDDFPKELIAAATTLRHECGAKISKRSLFEKIILNLEKMYIILTKEGFEKIRGEWNSYCLLLNRVVTVKTIADEVTGVA